MPISESTKLENSRNFYRDFNESGYIFENDVNKWQRDFLDALRLSACHLAAPLYPERVT